jgi:hypothetical protein
MGRELYSVEKVELARARDMDDMGDMGGMGSWGCGRDPDRDPPGSTC